MFQTFWCHSRFFIIFGDDESVTVNHCKRWHRLDLLAVMSTPNFCENAEFSGWNKFFLLNWSCFYCCTGSGLIVWMKSFLAKRFNVDFSQPGLVVSVTPTLYFLSLQVPRTGHGYLRRHLLEALVASNPLPLDWGRGSVDVGSAVPWKVAVLLLVLVNPVDTNPILTTSRVLEVWQRLHIIN